MLLHYPVDSKSSDRHLRVGLPPPYRTHGELEPRKEPPLTREDIESMILSIMPDRNKKEYAETNDKLVIVGGSLGDRPLDVAGVKALAALPSLDQLRGRLIGMLSTPATRIAAVMNATARQLERALGAYGSKGEAA